MELILNIFDWIKYQSKMLKHRPKLLYHSLWVRKDEFHSSLELNISAYEDMNENEKKLYLIGLDSRREFAHTRSLNSGK